MVVAASYGAWPIARAPASSVIHNDVLLVGWILSWDVHALTRFPLRVFDANSFHPDAASLAYSENLIGLAVLVAPLWWLTHNPALLHNVALLAMYALGGFGAYLLVRHVTRATDAAVVTGAAYAMLPFLVSQALHLHVVAMPAVPYGVLLVLRLVERPRWSRAAALAALVAAQWWMSMTGGALLLLVIGSAAIWVFVSGQGRFLRVSALVAAAVVVGMVPVAPLIALYSSVRPEQVRYDFERYAATTTSYLLPYSVGAGPVRGLHERLEGRLLPVQGDAPWEKRLFPGLWSVAGALAAVVVAVRRLARDVGSGRRRRRPGGHPTHDEAADPPPRLLTGLWLVVAAVGGVLSFGTRLHGVRLPTAVLFEHLPLGRVPARYGVLVHVALTLLAGCALGSASRRARRLLVPASLAVLALQSAAPAFDVRPPPVVTAAHRAIADRRGAVLALPALELYGPGGVTSSVSRDAIHLYLSTAHFRPLVNGYAVFVPDAYLSIAARVQDFPSAGGLEALEGVGVDTVVVQTDLVIGTRWADVAARMDNWPGVELVAQAPGVRVYDLSGDVSGAVR